jgi:alcohol dehydrogenase
VAIDLSDARLKEAREFGADVIVNNSLEDPLAVIGNLTGRLGADVVIEAVGKPATFELAVKLARPAGRVANIGIHGRPVTLHLEEQWPRDLTITTGLVDTSSTLTLMRLVAAGQLDAGRLVTHRFSMGAIEGAYDLYGDAASGALKVVLTRE